MTDHEFQNMLLATLTDIKEQGKERDDRLEKRLEAIDTQAKENNDRLEKRLEAIDTQAKENNDRLEKRLEAIGTRVGGVERDVGWIKGKLEGKQDEL